MIKYVTIASIYEINFLTCVFGPTHVSLSLQSMCYDLINFTKFLLFT